MPEAIKTILAKEEILALLSRYARAVDQADEELLRSCYHLDAIEEHGPNFSGSAEAYIQRLMSRLPSMGTMAHYVFNVLVDMKSPQVAYVESSVVTFLRIEKDGSTFDTLTGGRQLDRVENREGAWRIAHRKLVFDWNRDAPATQSSPRGAPDPLRHQAPGHPARSPGDDLAESI